MMRFLLSLKMANIMQITAIAFLMVVEAQKKKIELEEEIVLEGKF